MTTKPPRVCIVCFFVLTAAVSGTTGIVAIPQQTSQEPQFDPEWNLKRNCPDLPVLRDNKGKIVWFNHEQMKQMALVKVTPETPPLARQARVEGEVVLNLCVSTDGLPHKIWAISGHPMLIPSAIHATSQWRFKPYTVKSKPIAFAGTLRFTFSSSKGYSY